jgi:hypothetical protein
MNAKKLGVIVVAVALMAIFAAAASAQEAQGEPGQGRRGRGGDFVQELIGLITEATGLTVEEIRAQVAEGATLAEVIVANGGSVDAVVDQALATASDRLDAAVADGTISEEQAAERLAALEERLTAVLNGEWGDRGRGGPEGPGRGPRGRGGERGFGLIEAVAEATGLEREAIRESLLAGSTLAGILTENGVDIDTFIAERLADIEARLDQAVEAGRLTEEQAAERLAQASERLTEMLNRSIEAEATETGA